jgi:hypothetical protein
LADGEGFDPAETVSAGIVAGAILEVLTANSSWFAVESESPI